MRQFVESLRRLYKAKRIGEEKILTFYSEGKISQEEKEYILAPEMI